MQNVDDKLDRMSLDFTHLVGIPFIGLDGDSIINGNCHNSGQSMALQKKKETNIAKEGFSFLYQHKGRETFLFA